MQHLVPWAIRILVIVGVALAAVAYAYSANAAEKPGKPMNLAEVAQSQQVKTVVRSQVFCGGITSNPCDNK